MSKIAIILVLLLQGWIVGSPISDTFIAYTISIQDLSWSDDFEDGDFEGWMAYGALEGDKLPGNFTITDGALIAQGINWNLAFHDSPVVYGTWSLDVYPVDREHNEILVAFILENHTVVDWWRKGYIVQLVTGPYRHYTEHTITLVRAYQWPNDIHWLDDASTGNLTGWQHIDITRDRWGHICVYLNGTLYLSSVDSHFTSSELFCFCGESGQGIDNVTVTADTITIDKAAPIWIPGAPADKTIEQGQLFRYDLNASDPSEIDSWWLNDTARFDIDDDGVITNRTALDIGQYGIQVWVNDTKGYTLTNSFTVIVLGAVPENGSLSLEVLTLGTVASIVIIALVIVIVRSRSRN